MRLLHTADWQIGRTYAFFDPDDAAILAEARTTTVERIAALATEERVDLVVVAGDVFDAQTVTDRTIRRLFLAMQGFAGPWCLLPGNHDAALAESVWTRAHRLGVLTANLHLLLRPEPLLLPDAGVAILPAPLTQRQTTGDLTAALDTMQTPPGLIRIGVGHGAVEGVLPEGIDSSNPIAPDRAETARLDYLALGDWHGCKEINARTWYSGTPEPERYVANDPGQILLVEIGAPGATPMVERHPIGQFQWVRWEQEFQVAEDVEALNKRLSTLDNRFVVRLDLSGVLDITARQRLLENLAAVSARVRALEYDLSEIRLQPTDADIANMQADGYLSDVIGELRDRSAVPDQKEAATEALVILADILQNQQGAA